MVYTHENRFFVSNAKNIVSEAGIDTFLKNEYAAGAAGDLAPLDSWLELWVINDNDHQTALSLIESAFTKNSQSPWTCILCNEKNEASFEICWSCRTEHKAIE